jgi:apolipoprotein N-acyltransferase
LRGETRALPAAYAAALCAASGVSVSFCFWPYRTGFLAYAVLVPFILASGLADGRGRYLLNSFIFGLAYFMGSLYWIAMLDRDQIALPWLRLPAAVVLSLYLSLFMVAAGWLTRRLVLIGIPFAAAFAAAWAATEYLRSLGPLGFPWASLGYSQTPYLGIVQTASVVGTYGMSGLIVLVNGLLAGLLSSRRWPYAAAAGALVVIPALAGQVVLGKTVHHPAVEVGLVQPNVSGAVKWDTAYRDTSMAVLERLSLQSAGARLIVWPETAVPYNVLRDPMGMESIAAVAESMDAYLVVGCPEYEIDRDEVRYFNSAFMMSPSGSVQGLYRKIHLVPFGETFPFEERFEILKRVDLGQGDFSPGNELTVFDLNGTPFAVAVCFEAIYPDLVGDFVRSGARVIVNITNDEWFGPSIGPSQHAQMAVMRAVEFRVGLARCANTGISMIVDPYGRVRDRTPLFRRCVLVGPMEEGTGGTVYARIEGRFETVLLVACFGLALASYPVRRRRGEMV